MNRLMYFSCNRTESDISIREDLFPYWSPPFKEYVISGGIPYRGYDDAFKIVYRDQITGKLISDSAHSLDSLIREHKKNVYGHAIYSTTQNLVNAGYRWIDNLQTYVHSSIIDDQLTVKECIKANGDKGVFASEIYNADDSYRWSERQSIFIHEDNACSIYGGDDCVSSSYFNDHYFTCNGCDGTFHNDLHCGDGCCENCFESDSETPERSAYDACAVEAYGFYNGKGKHNTEIPGLRYFGLEIEIELDESGEVSELREDVESAGLALGCADGSLSEACGLELKTPPMLSGHYREYLTRLYKIIDRYGYSVNDETGLHVNVSRSSVTNLTIGKVVCFLHHPKNADFVAFIAERDSNHWADWEKLKNIKSDLRDNLEYRCESKYTACNIKQQVLEFRIFHGIKSMKKAIKGIEFCDALINYCSAQSVIKATTGRLTEQDFKTWLSGRKKQYPELSEYIFGKLPLFETNSNKEKEEKICA